MPLREEEMEAIARCHQLEEQVAALRNQLAEMDEARAVVLVVLVAVPVVLVVLAY